MRKSISIVTSVPLTEPVVRNRLFPFFETFIQQGYQVRCVCPLSDFSEEQLPEGVQLETVQIEFAKPDSFVRRAMREARDVATLLKHARSLPDEVILVTLPSMFLAFLAPVYLRKRRVVMDVRDLSWEYLSDASRLQRLAKGFFRFCFKRSVHFFQLIAATNTTEMEYLQRISPRLNPLHVSNGIRREQFDALKQIQPSQEKRFTISYIGNIGLAQQLETLIEAARQLPQYQFNLVGSGIDAPRVQALVREYGLDNVCMTGRVSWEEVQEYYHAAHVLYAQLTPDFSGAMPSKLYEYLSTGKPVVYGGLGQAVDTLAQFEQVVVVPPCQLVQLTEALVQLEGEVAGMQRSEKNQQAIEYNYIRENAAQLLVNAVDTLF